MVKTLLMILFSVSGSLSMAANKNKWIAVYESREETDSEVGFKMMQKKYPTIFGKFDTKAVYTANITVGVYQFRGQHSCAENDLRLLIESNAYGACVKIDGKGNCFQAAARMPVAKDPCAIN